MVATRDAARQGASPGMHAGAFDVNAHLVTRALSAARSRRRRGPSEAPPAAPSPPRPRASDVPEPAPIDAPPVPPERDLPEPSPIDTPPVPPTPDVPDGPVGVVATVRRVSR